MNGHHKEHHRKHRATGGVNEAAEDMREKSENYTAGAKRVEGEAKERKHGGGVGHGKKHGDEHHHPSCKCHKCHGGRAERKRGGGVHEGHKHHEAGEHMKHAKHIGHVHGERNVAHLGRHARKSGGRTGSDSHPFSSARAGTNPPGHKTENVED